MIDVLGMIAEADEIAAAREIHKLEPWLIRDGQKELAAAQRYEAVNHFLWLKEVLKRLQRHDKIKAALIKGRVEQISAGEGFTWPAPACVGERVGAKVHTFITAQRDVTFCELVEDKAFPAAEVEDARRAERSNDLSDAVVEAPEA